MSDSFVPCTLCGKHSTLKCAGCLNADYCCPVCQKQHWDREHQFTCGKAGALAVWVGFEDSIFTIASGSFSFYVITQRHVALTVDVVRRSFVLHKYGASKALDDQATTAVLAQLNEFSAQLLRATGADGQQAATRLKELFTEHTVLAKTYAVQVFQGKKEEAGVTLDKLVNHNGKAMHKFLGDNALVKTPGIADRIGDRFMAHLTTTAAYISAANEQDVKSIAFWKYVWIAMEVGRELGAALDAAYPAA